MSAADEPASLEDVVLRDKLEAKVRAEHAAREEHEREHDKAVFALGLAATLAGLFFLPAWAAIVALACRVFVFVYNAPLPHPW